MAPISEQHQLSSATSLDRYPNLYRATVEFFQAFSESSYLYKILIIGGSTGEEPYTLATKYFTQNNVKIVSSEINKNALDSSIANYPHENIRYIHPHIENPSTYGPIC